MKIPNYFGEMIREARKSKGLLQKEVERTLRLRRGRLSDLERNRRAPTTRELNDLARLLEIPLPWLKATVDSYEPKLARERQRFWLDPRFYPRQQRPSYVRLAHARERYPQVVKELEWELDERPDLKSVQLYLRDQAFDSCLELVCHLKLLAQGAVPGWEAPAAWGFEAETVIDPGTGLRIGARRRPALYLAGPIEAIVFAQVGVLLSRRVRLDLLVGTAAGWKCLEFDGLGHDPRLDHIREELSIPVTRLGPEIVTGDLLEAFPS